MKRSNSKSIIAIFVGLFLLIGVIEFVFKRNHSFILYTSYFEYWLGFTAMNALPIGKGWEKLRYVILVFLSFYLPLKIGSFLNITGLTITLNVYLVVLGIVLLVFGGLFFQRRMHRASWRYFIVLVGIYRSSFGYVQLHKDVKDTMKRDRAWENRFE